MAKLRITWSNSNPPPKSKLTHSMDRDWVVFAMTGGNVVAHARADQVLLIEKLPDTS